MFYRQKSTIKMEIKLKELQDAIRSILKEEDMSFLNKVGHWIDTSEWGDEERDPRSMRHPKLNTVVDVINDAIDEVPHKEMKSFLWGLNHDFANGIQIESKEKNMNESRVLREEDAKHLDDVVDDIIQNAAPEIVRAIKEREVDEDVDEFYEGTIDAVDDLEAMLDYRHQWEEKYEEPPTDSDLYRAGYAYGEANFDKIQKGMQDIVDSGTRRELVKDAIAEFEERIANDFLENIGLLIGRNIEDLDEGLRKMINDAYGYQGLNSQKAAELQVEIARFYDATQSEKFGEVTKLMSEVQPSEKMDRLADLTLRNQTSRVMGAAKELAGHFNKWADILDPKNDEDGGDGGEGGEGGQPNEDLIERMRELLRLRQAEMDLREQTRQLEAEHATRKPEQLEEDTFDLRFRQLMLSGDLQLEMEKRGEGEFLNAARYRMRDAEDELNLPGDAEGLMEAYQWALVAKAQVKGDAEKLKAVDQTLKGLEAHLSDKQIKNATGRADKLLNNN